MANGDLFGKPYGKITAINVGATGATVNVTTPLIRIGDSSVNEAFYIAVGGSHTISVPAAISLVGTNKEQKGNI